MIQCIFQCIFHVLFLSSSYVAYNIDNLGFPYFSKTLSKISLLCLVLMFLFFYMPSVSITYRKSPGQSFKALQTPWFFFWSLFLLPEMNTLFLYSDLQHHLSLFSLPYFSFREIILSPILDCILFSRGWEIECWFLYLN